MGDAIFEREGDAYLPTRFASNPWTAQALHGGPPAVLAHAIEQQVGDQRHRASDGVDAHPHRVHRRREVSPVGRAAALSDFGDALANQAAHLAHISADITLHLHRDPSEWLCLQHDHRDESHGVGFVESIWYDEAGRYARGVQSRLANAR